MKYSNEYNFLSTTSKQISFVHITLANLTIGSIKKLEKNVTFSFHSILIWFWYNYNHGSRNHLKLQTTKTTYLEELFSYNNFNLKKINKYKIYIYTSIY